MLHLCRRPRGRNISPASRSYTLNTREWGVVYLYTNIEERACDLAVYIIENRATVRSAATQFGISKSTVHADATKRNGSSGGFGDRKTAIFRTAAKAACFRTQK